MSSQGYTNANLELWVKCSGDGLTIQNMFIILLRLNLPIFRLPSGGIEYILMNAWLGLWLEMIIRLICLAKGSQLLISAQSFENSCHVYWHS